MKTNMENADAKKCVDCSSSQQIKCFGAEVVSRGIGKNKKCVKQK
jgi:hypothetical protein